MAHAVEQSDGSPGRPVEEFVRLLPDAPPRQFRRGQGIALPIAAVGQVLDGVVSRVAVHVDGTEVLLGLLGPGDVLFPHPDDLCHISIAAHTNVTIAVGLWRDLVDGDVLAITLHSQFLRLEAWAAMQAHPYVDRRLRGLLSLLAERFGEPHPRGCLINLRLTHQQLANAASCTRASVTRFLGDLVRSDELIVEGAGSAQRLCLVGLPAGPTPVRHSRSAWEYA